MTSDTGCLLEVELWDSPELPLSQHREGHSLLLQTQPLGDKSEPTAQERHSYLC